LVDYDARFVANKGDKVLADLVVPGKYLQADGKPLAVALLQAYEQTHARRFSVMGCSDGKNVTKGHSGGVGVTSSGINAAGNVGTSGSFGFNFGKSTSGFEGFDVLRVRALNRNGDLIELNESARHSAASPSPLPQSSTLPLPPVQTLRIEVVAVAPSLAITANTNLPAAATLPTPQTVPTDACAIPAFSAHFAYNHPLPEQEGNLGIGNILEGDRPQIAKMAEWLKNNPTCKVEVRGYASPEGDRIFNEGLGSRRARAVENALIAAGVSPTSMTHTSSGKDYLIAPGAEYYDADRRAIVQVLGPASGR